MADNKTRIKNKTRPLNDYLTIFNQSFDTTKHLVVGRRHELKKTLKANNTHIQMNVELRPNCH